MRIVFLVFFTLFMQNVIAIPGFIVSYKDKLVFYDMENNVQKEIVSINNLVLWEFGNCQYQNNEYRVTLYKRSEYSSFSQKKYLSEIIIRFDEKSVTLKNDTIIEKDCFYRVSNLAMEQLSIKNIKELYFNKNLISNNTGFIEIKDNKGDIISILESEQIDKGYKIGYFNPSFSSDGRKIVCEKVIGKHDWKKIKGATTIVEYDIPQKEIKEFFIEGCCPLYSKDNKYILYKKDNKCLIYDTISEQILFSCEAYQAIWVE